MGFPVRWRADDRLCALKIMPLQSSAVANAGKMSLIIYQFFLALALIPPPVSITFYFLSEAIKRRMALAVTNRK